MPRLVGEVEFIGEGEDAPTALKTETWVAFVDFKGGGKLIRTAGEYMGAADPYKGCPIWYAFERAMEAWRDYYEDPRWVQKYDCAPAMHWDFEYLLEDMKPCRDAMRYRLEWHRMDRRALAKGSLKPTAWTARVRRDRGIINGQIAFKLREKWGWFEQNNLPGCPGYLISLRADSHEDDQTRLAAERSYFLRKARPYRLDTIVGRLPPWPHGYDESLDE